MRRKPSRISTILQRTVVVVLGLTFGTILIAGAIQNIRTVQESLIVLVAFFLGAPLAGLVLYAAWKRAGQ